MICRFEPVQKISPVKANILLIARDLMDFETEDCCETHIAHQVKKKQKKILLHGNMLGKKVKV